jgi:DNA-binding LacI/PurR family transcriptional regulator
LLDLPLSGVLGLRKLGDDVLSKCERLNVPVVYVDRPPTNRGLHTISVENKKGAMDATRRMLSLGHRRIALVRFVSMAHKGVEPDALERQAGFLQAMREFGETNASEMVFSVTWQKTQKARKFRDLFSAKPAFTAVLASGDALALEVEKSAQEHGFRVPEDVSIACFQPRIDALPHFAGPCVDFFEMGRQAVHLLKKPKKPRQTVRLETVWSPGRTLQRPKSDDSG